MGPITAENLIQRSLAIFGAGFAPFATLALIFYAPAAFLQVAVVESTGPGPETTFATGAGLVFLFAHVVLIPVATAAVVYGVFEGLRGRRATIGQCLSVAASRWTAILGLSILTVLVVGTGFLLFVIPGIIATYGLFVAGPVLIVEGLEPVEAMKRSWKLTDGFKMILLVLALTIGLLHLAITVMINLAFGFEALGADAASADSGLYHVVSSLVTVVFVAVKAVAAGVAYHDLRSFREGAAPESKPAA